MIQIIPSKNLYTSDHGWLSSKFLFSFADYFDPNNIEWGALRVFNDDTIKGESGFPMHPHNNMEIVTIMLSGTLTHKDTLGNTREITQGDIQYMSAGTGVIHSEINNGDKDVELFQLWFHPKERGLLPNYAEKNFSYLTRQGAHLLASPDGKDGSIAWKTEAELLYINLSAESAYTVILSSSEKILMYIRKGSLTCNDITLHQSDQLRITGDENLSFTANSDTEFVLIRS